MTGNLGLATIFALTVTTLSTALSHRKRKIKIEDSSDLGSVTGITRVDYIIVPLWPPFRNWVLLVVTPELFSTHPFAILHPTADGREIIAFVKILLNWPNRFPEVFYVLATRTMRDRNVNCALQPRWIKLNQGLIENEPVEVYVS